MAALPGRVSITDVSIALFDQTVSAIVFNEDIQGVLWIALGASHSQYGALLGSLRQSSQLEGAETRRDWIQISRPHLRALHPHVLQLCCSLPAAGGYAEEVAEPRRHRLFEERVAQKDRKNNECDIVLVRWTLYDHLVSHARPDHV